MKAALFASFFMLFATSHVSGALFTVETTNVGFSSTSDPLPQTQNFLDQLENFGTHTTLSRGSGIEPTLAVNPSSENNMATFWIQNPYFILQDFGNIGGQDAGIAYTNDQGNTWKQTLIPLSNSLGGIAPFIDNLWSDYSSDGKVLYLTGIAYDFSSDSKIFTARSSDGGMTWDKPQFIKTRLNQTDNYDKPSITADPNNPSHAYIVCDDYDDDNHSNHSVAVISRTTNYGKTWSPFSLVYDPFPDLLATGLSDRKVDHNYIINNIVIAPINGDLLHFMTRTYTPSSGGSQVSDIAFVRSKDHGKRWSKKAKRVVSIPTDDKIYPGGFTFDSQGEITGGKGHPFMAAQQLFSIAINPANGYIYIAWNDPNLTTPKSLQIAMVSSRDGGKTWSQPIQINKTPQESQAYLPAIAVTKDGYVGVLYDDFRFDDHSDLHHTKTDVWLAIYQEVANPSGGSTGVGLNFVEEHRLTPQSFITQHAPPYNGQHQNGDYSFLRAGAKNFYAAYFVDFDGPFTQATLLRDNISIENNVRNAPFVSIIKQ